MTTALSFPLLPGLELLFKLCILRHGLLYSTYRERSDYSPFSHGAIRRYGLPENFKNRKNTMPTSNLKLLGWWE